MDISQSFLEELGDNWFGTSLFHFGVLERGVVPPGAAEALLVVIPKEVKPTTMKGFRPLSLCNVPIKVVSKTIVNRLKMMMPHIISPN